MNQVIQLGTTAIPPNAEERIRRSKLYAQELSGYRPEIIGAPGWCGELRASIFSTQYLFEREIFVESGTPPQDPEISGTSPNIWR